MHHFYPLQYSVMQDIPYILTLPHVLFMMGTNPSKRVTATPLHTSGTSPSPHVPQKHLIPPPIMSNSIHTITHLQNHIKYMHQAFFCLPEQTLLRAASLGFLNNMPFLTLDLIHRYLTKSPAMAKGRLKLHPSGYQSTRQPRPALPHQPHAHTMTYAANIFCYTALADKQASTFYTNCTGALLHHALDGQCLFFVAYACDPNYIFVVPITSTSTNNIMTAFQSVYNTIETNGYKPALNITDNQAASGIKIFMNSRGGAMKLVEPNNHCVNVAKWAIQTFKNLFISGLCTTDPQFPLQLWKHRPNHLRIQTAQWQK